MLDLLITGTSDGVDIGIEDGRLVPVAGRAPHKTELRMLRVARAIEEYVPVQIVTTYLGAHTVPPEFDGDADGYIDFVCNEVLPAVADEELADAVDGFCESIAFTTAQIDRVFTA